MDEKAFLRWFDGQLAAIWRKLPKPRNLSQQQKTVERLLDQVTHSQRPDGRTCVEPNRLLNCDWRKKHQWAESHGSDLKLTVGPVACLVEDNLLTRKQRDLLIHVLYGLVGFALDVKTIRQAAPVGRELQREIETYLSFRDYHLPPRAKSETRRGPTPSVQNVTIHKKHLAFALNVSASTLRSRLKAGEIELASPAKRTAKVVCVELAQFSKNEQSAIRAKLRMPAS